MHINDAQPPADTPSTSQIMAASQPARRLNVMRLARVRAVDEVEEAIEFRPGVNVVVGAPNSGKSKWLRTLDFLFGESDPPEAKLGTRYAQKYLAAHAVLAIDGREVLLERRWGKGQPRTKTFIAGDAAAPDEFSDVFMQALGLPVLRFPAGNPYAPRAWPRLSWRMLYRHVYRHEKSWGDIAAGQSEPEQFACLMLFLGAAERLFPSSYGEMVAKQRDKDVLVARKEQYVATLEDVTRELVAVQEASVALTEESLNAAATRLRENLEEATRQREALLQSLQEFAVGRTEAEDVSRRGVLAAASERLAALRTAREDAEQRLAKERERRTGLERHRRLVTDELAKLERARSAQTELADLRVTHCPSCDQPLTRPNQSGHCRLCLQPHAEYDDDGKAAAHRLEFEVQQLDSEARELDELVRERDNERELAMRRLRDLDDEIALLDSQLRPARAVVASILPPELSAIDQSRGRLQEQLRQIDRIHAALHRREELTRRIDALSEEIQILDASRRQQRSTVKFALTSDVLADGMNSYLNALNSGSDSPRWRGGRVGVLIRDRDVRLTLNGREWRGEAGGTYTFFFLAAYQFALLGLATASGAAYPGLVVIDLPPNVSDNRVLTDEENYLAEPFVRLLARPEMAGAQVILTGHAYQNLRGANRVEMDRVFEPEPDDET